MYAGGRVKVLAVVFAMSAQYGQKILPTVLCIPKKAVSKATAVLATNGRKK